MGALSDYICKSNEAVDKMEEIYMYTYIYTCAFATYIFMYTYILYNIHYICGRIYKIINRQ